MPLVYNEKTKAWGSSQSNLHPHFIFAPVSLPSPSQCEEPPAALALMLPIRAPHKVYRL